MKINIIGVDPSLKNFGLVNATYDLDTSEIDINGMKLSTPPKADAATKKQVRRNSDDLRRAHHQFTSLEAAAKSASIMIVEVPVGSQSSRAMASYGICVGILASVKIPMIQVTPTEVKLIATGTKTASKQDMIDWATSLYPNAPWLTRKSKGELVYTNANEHLADAVAAIHAGIETDQFRQATAMMRSLIA